METLLRVGTTLSHIFNPIILQYLVQHKRPLNEYRTELQGKRPIRKLGLKTLTLFSDPGWEHSKDRECGEKENSSTQPLQDYNFQATPITTSAQSRGNTHSGGHLDPKTTLVMLGQRKGGTPPPRPPAGKVSPPSRRILTAFLSPAGGCAKPPAVLTSPFSDAAEDT